MITQHDQPISFYSQPPGFWQFGFWASWVALSLVLAVGWWSEPISSGRLIVSLGLAFCFAGFFVATLRRRQRELKPAVIASSDGLRFRSGTASERFVRWDQLKKVVDDRRGSIVFGTIDNRTLGGRALLIFATGNYVSATCQTQDGTKLATAVPAMWQEAQARSGH